MRCHCPTCTQTTEGGNASFLSLNQLIHLLQHRKTTIQRFFYTINVSELHLRTNTGTNRCLTSGPVGGYSPSWSTLWTRLHGGKWFLNPGNTLDSYKYQQYININSTKYRSGALPAHLDIAYICVQIQQGSDANRKSHYFIKLRAFGWIQIEHVEDKLSELWAVSI